MYESLKHLVKTIIPSNILKGQEKNLRKIYGLFFRGRKFKCNICNTNLRRFIQLKSTDLICPHCGSIPRTRGLWNILESKLKDQSVLHFSPSPSLKMIIELKGKTKEYISTDYEGEFDADQKYNILNLAIDNESVDIIICYHILEHVKNDIKALQELKRVLKNSGTCYVQTPFKAGTIYEDFSITTAADRLKHFGQEDHLRIYSAEGLKERMESVGFKIDVHEIVNKPGNYNGLKTRDIILKCKKAAS